MVSTKARLLVPVALDVGCWPGWDEGICTDFLRRWTSLELQKRVDHFLAVTEDRPEFLPASVSGSNDVSQRNRVPRQLGRDRTAEEAAFVKDTDLAHVAFRPFLQL